jgi:hypothetical protein
VVLGEVEGVRVAVQSAGDRSKVCECSYCKGKVSVNSVDEGYMFGLKDMSQSRSNRLIKVRGVRAAVKVGMLEKGSLLRCLMVLDLR